MARIGGEEFAVVGADLIRTGTDRCWRKKLRQGIESQTFHLGAIQNPADSSAWGSESQPLATARVTDLFNQLLMEADDSMIRAKRAGRNRIFSSTKWPEYTP